jgi:hypothetical protein
MSTRLAIARRGGILLGDTKPIGTIASSCGASGGGAGEIDRAGGNNVTGVPRIAHPARIATSNAIKKIPGTGLGIQAGSRADLNALSTVLCIPVTVPGFNWAQLLAYDHHLSNHFLAVAFLSAGGKGSSNRISLFDNVLGFRGIRVNID